MPENLSSGRTRFDAVSHSDAHYQQRRIPDFQLIRSIGSGGFKQVSSHA